MKRLSKIYNLKRKPPKVRISYQNVAIQFSCQERSSDVATYVPYLLSPPAKIWIVCSFAFCLITSWITDLQVEISFFCVSRVYQTKDSLQTSRGVGYSWEFLVVVCSPVLQILTLFDLFRPKNVIFHSRFHTRPLKIHTRFQTWPLGRNYLIIT